MAETEATIVINAVGGDQAAAEINKASFALDRTVTSSTAMEANFQHRFQHIGLMLFAGDALKASGLGMEARQVITLLNSSLMAGETAFGLSAGGAILWISAIGAVVGMIAKVVDHHKELIAQLEKTHAATEKSIQQNEKVVSSINQYVAAGGQLTTSLARFKDLSEQVTKIQMQQQIATDEQTAAILKQNIALEQNAIDNIKATKEEDFRRLVAIAGGSVYPGQINYTRMQADALKAQTAELVKNKAQLQGVIVELEQLKKGNAKTIDEMASSQKELTDAIQAELSRRKSAQEAFDKSMEELSDHAIKHDEEIQKKYTSFLTSNFESAYEKILKNQESFGDAMLEAFTSMIERMIAEVLALITVWSILDIVSGGATGSPMNPGSLGDFMKGGFKFASGGSMFVDRPTLALFGEAGPEQVTFNPLTSSSSSSGGSSGGGDINIGSINVNAYGVTDPKKIADSVGREIVKSIRGQGQINFARA